MKPSASQLPSAPSATKPVISIKAVTHRYGKVTALNDISLDIPSGLMVGIIGPDGVGKSTLINQLTNGFMAQFLTVVAVGAVHWQTPA